MNETIKKLGDVEVLTPDGESFTLGTAWAEQSILLAIIRHFG